jgi:hypothetical protein
MTNFLLISCCSKALIIFGISASLDQIDCTAACNRNVFGEGLLRGQIPALKERVWGSLNNVDAVASEKSIVVKRK